MEVIPAIDLRDGKCVRLRQGDFSQETIYGDDPVLVARRWRDAGARLLHVVDLDGARAGEPRNLTLIERIVADVGIPVQLGGGLRQRDHIERAIASGVSRVVIGTAALEDTDLVSGAVAAYGERLVVGIDARDGRVAVRGWLNVSDVLAEDLAREMTSLGVRRFVFTDIARDGMLSEPNYASLAAFMRAAEMPVIASGGVGSLEHVRRLATLGAEAVIVGRALYTGDIDLAEAIAEAAILGESG